MSTLIPNNRFTSAENRRIDTIPCKNRFEDRKGASTNNLYLFIKLIRLKNIHEVSIHHALHNRSIYLCIFRWFLHKISDVSATNSSVGQMLFGEEGSLILTHPLSFLSSNAHYVITLQICKSF